MRISELLEEIRVREEELEEAIKTREVEFFYRLEGAKATLDYSREVAARSEQYWCPIKHAGKILHPHSRYARFADFGDPDGYRQLLKSGRDALTDEADF